MTMVRLFILFAISVSGIWNYENAAPAQRSNRLPARVPGLNLRDLEGTYN